MSRIIMLMVLSVYTVNGFMEFCAFCKHVCGRRCSTVYFCVAKINGVMLFVILSSKI